MYGRLAYLRCMVTNCGGLAIKVSLPEPLCWPNGYHLGVARETQMQVPILICNLSSFCNRFRLPSLIYQFTIVDTAFEAFYSC